MRPTRPQSTRASGAGCRAWRPDSSPRSDRNAEARGSWRKAREHMDHGTFPISLLRKNLEVGTRLRDSGFVEVPQAVFDLNAEVHRDAQEIMLDESRMSDVLERAEQLSGRVSAVIDVLLEQTSMMEASTVIADGSKYAAVLKQHTQEKSP